jgi:CarboxypepD_reg-like domain
VEKDLKEQGKTVTVLRAAAIQRHATKNQGVAKNYFNKMYTNYKISRLFITFTLYNKPMRYFVVILFLLLPLLSGAQTTQTTQTTDAAQVQPATVSGTIVSDNTLLPISGASVININKVKGTVTDTRGNFTLEATANDTIHISFIGYASVKVRVTNDWTKNTAPVKITLTEKAYTLDEVVINSYNLTGFLQVDAKLAPVQQPAFRYNISSLGIGYESAGGTAASINKVLSSVFNPADLLHNTFGKKGNEMRRLREMKKDDAVRNALASKFDRETLSALLGVTKEEIGDILERCNYSEEFINTANDLQIMDAISGCYEEYKAVNHSSASN